MPKSALPASLTPLLGREQECDRLRQLLTRPEVRLITLTGPGGVGKTSLAVQVARQAQGSFAEGVFYVSLAPVRDPTLILPTIAQALGLPESPGRLWLDRLKDDIGQRSMLLLLDNFEQIIAAAPLLTELLSACGGLRLLVTSREALRVRGEQEFLLSPLALPDQTAAETLLACPSVALFVARAQAAQLDFRLTPENAAAVAEICVRLDGLPLAIELAAARLKLFPPAALLARLRASPLQLLTGGARDLPARQQTLRHTVQWSYDLLEAEARRAFRWLAVFTGGCALEAALAVLGPPASVEVLESLLSQSLLRQTETGAAARLVMLETIREFGWEQLAQAGEAPAARRAHAAFYLSLAEESEQELAGANQKDWLQRLDREQDNLRAALRWVIEQRDSASAQRLAGALMPFWFARGHWGEGRRWLEQALALGAAPDPAVQAKALYGAGVLARFQGDLSRSRMLGQQSLALYRALADQTGVVKALAYLARLAGLQGDQAATNAFVAEAAALLAAAPDTVVKADTYTDLVLIKATPGAAYPPEAAHYLAESERLHRALHNLTGIARAVLQQANLALWQGDYAQAASRFDEAERLAIALGDDRLKNRVAASRVPLDLRTNDFATARRRLEDSLLPASDRGDAQLPAWLALLAAVLYKQGLPEWSARVFGLAEAWPETGYTDVVYVLVSQYCGVGDILVELRAQMGDEAFAQEMAIGRRLTVADLRAMPHPLEPAPAPAALTAREIEVLRLLAQDLSNPQIAERLVISRRTVEAHLRSIYDKLGVKSRDAASRAAQAHGLLGKSGPERK